MAWNDGEFVFFPTSNGAASDFKTASQSEKKTLFGKKKKKTSRAPVERIFYAIWGSCYIFRSHFLTKKLMVFGKRQYIFSCPYPECSQARLNSTPIAQFPTNYQAHAIAEWQTSDVNDKWLTLFFNCYCFVKPQNRSSLRAKYPQGWPSSFQPADSIKSR